MEQYEQDSKFERVIGPIIMASVSLLGIIGNLSAAVLIFQVPVLRNIFGYLTTSLLIANSGELLYFLVWCAPIGLTESHALAVSEIGKKFSQVTIFFYHAGFYSHFLMSVNRFTAINFPLYYKNVFENKFSFLWVVFPWIIPFFYILPYFHPSCYLLFYPEQLEWIFAATDCNRLISFWLDFVHGMTMSAMILTLDTISLLRLRKYFRRKTNNVVMQQKERRQIRFFLQTFFNGLVFCIPLLSFHLFSKYATCKCMRFILEIVLWEAAHSSSGLIVFAFNKEVRQALCCQQSRKKSSRKEHSKTKQGQTIHRALF